MKDKKMKDKKKKTIVVADENTLIIDGNGKVIKLKRFESIESSDKILIQNAKKNKLLKVEEQNE